MPEVTLEQLGIDPHIWLDVDDKVIDGTRRKFKAEVMKLVYNPRDKHVTVKVTLYPYSAIDNGDGTFSYGTSLANIPGFSVEEDLLIANDTTIVNMEGVILGDRATLASSPEAIAINEAPPVLDEAGNIITPAGPLYDEATGSQWMGEYAFFKMLSVTQDIRIEPMLKGKVISKHGDGTGTKYFNTQTTPIENENGL